MIQRCILIIIIAFTTSCNYKSEKKTNPRILNLTIIDSTLVKENNFFLNGQATIKMVGDSIIAVSSRRTPAVGFINLKTGDQFAQIASEEFPEARFFPSAFDISDYPKLYILDRKGAILQFDVMQNKFLGIIKLNIPSDKKVRLASGEFKKTPEGFLVQLEITGISSMDPSYYKKSGDLLYLFNTSGRIIWSTLEYPQVFMETKGSMNNQNFLTSSYTENKLIYSFPSERKLKRLNLSSSNNKVVEEIELPESKYFNYNLNSLDQILSFEDMKTEKGRSVIFPTNHYFNTIIEDEGEIIISTWMNNNELAPNNSTFSNLFIYNKNKEEWSETSNPRNILDIGMLAGAVNDTLYFYEGSLMKHDEKYIKRALLSPIQQ